MRYLLQKWNVQDLPITPIESVWKSAWDIGGEYILKRVSDIKQFEKTLQFNNLLSAENIPVAKFIPAFDGQMTAVYEDNLYCMMVKLPGNHIDLYEQPSLAVVMGRETARLHKGLARIESKISCEETDLLGNWLNYIKPRLGNDVPAEKIEDTEKQILEFHTKLPRQLIHRDVHLKNVLFDKGHLTGWFDFDLACRHVRMFDIAYLLSSLSCESEQDHEKAEAWRLIGDELLRGYNEVSPLSDCEYAALPMLITVVDLLFTAFYSSYG